MDGAFRLGLLGAALFATAGWCGERTPAAEREEAGFEEEASVGEAFVGDEFVEEVTVVGKRPALSAKDRRRIYKQLAKGQELYARELVDEALPYLLATAEHGFKEAQATVGHIYLRGLGQVERDSVQAVGWMGVASSGSTAPAIRNYFNEIWKRIPEQNVPYFREVVDEYESKYGEHATGVVCELHSPASSYVKRLRCFFEQDLPAPMREDYDSYLARQEMSELAEERAVRVRQAMLEAQQAGSRR